MSGVVSQRMNNPLANIETGTSELIQKMFAMYIIFGEEDEFTFSNNGSVSTVTKEDMLGRSIISAKLKSQIKIQQQEQSRSALMVLQSLIALPQGVNKEALITTLVPIITQGVVSRKQSESFVEQNQLTPDQIAQLQQMLAAQQTPMFDQASLEGLNPQDMEMMSAAAQQGISPDGGLSEQMAMAQMNPEMSPYDQARTAAPTVNTGADNYTAGVEANANPMAGLI